MQNFFVSVEAHEEGQGAKSQQRSVADFTDSLFYLTL